MLNLQPKDVIAILIIIVYATLLIFHVESQLDSAIAIFIGYYFAKRSNVCETGI